MSESRLEKIIDMYIMDKARTAFKELHWDNMSSLSEIFQHLKVVWFYFAFRAY